MKPEDPKQRQTPNIFTGLNFRQIIDEAQNVSQDISEAFDDNLYIADEIQLDQSADKKAASILGYSKSVQESFGKFTGFLRRYSVFRFLIEFSLYLFQRTRVFFILISILGELLGTQIEVVKKMIIRRMFWGRSSLFKFSLQSFSLFLVFLLFISDNYRNKTMSDGYLLRSSVIAGAEPDINDIFVQNSSTKTQINESVARYDQTLYVVKGGDTLSTIAEEFGLQVNTILWANNLTTSDFIKPGMELTIPQGDGLLVEVKDGDTVESLSSEYEVNGQLILDANLIPYPYTLVNGMKILLPNVEKAAPPPPPVIAQAPVRQAPIYSGISTPAPVTTPIVQQPAPSGNRWLGWPSAGGRLSQCYSGWHNGIDIYDRSYPAIVAAAPGVVSFAGCQSGNCPAPGRETGGTGFAWTVMIDHGNGYETLYAHLNQIYVSTGQAVSAGQSVGQMGQSGLAYGIHVHFSLKYTGTYSFVNPAQFMTTSICGY